MGIKEQPNLDAAIRDRECAKSIDLNQLFCWNVWFEIFEEFVLIRQFHLITFPEEARVIRKDTASLHHFFVAIPRKDALVVRHADDLQLKTVKSLLPLSIQHRHIHVQQTHQRIGPVLHSSRHPIGSP